MHSDFFAVKMRHLAGWESFFISGVFTGAYLTTTAKATKTSLKSKYTVLVTSNFIALIPSR